MTNKVLREHERLVKKGVHVLIIKDRNLTTIQPITRRGYEAIYAMLEDNGAPKHFLTGLAKKRGGHYTAAVPVEANPGYLAKTLVQDYGLPDGSVGAQEVGMEITPIGVDQSIH